MPLNEAPLVFLDTEMTGLDPERDSLVEVCLVRVVGGHEVGSLTTLLRPASPSHPMALRLHGLTEDLLCEAPTFDRVAHDVEEILRGAVPIAHGPELDVVFLRRALASCGRQAPELDHVIDTIVLARRAVAAKSYALSSLAEALKLAPRRWHRAGEDVAGLRELFARLVPELAPRDARDLWEVRVGQRAEVRVRTAIAQRLEVLARSGAPARLVVRRRGQGQRPIDGVVERWRSPHVYVRDGASLRVVRADRILRIEPLA